MSKLHLLNFLVRPGELARGVKRLGLRGAVVHGVRRVSASVDHALLGPAQLRINPMGAVCNHTCPMCWLQQMTSAERKARFRVDRETGMDLDEYERLFETVPPGLTEVNVVGGGEPLVHPQARQILGAIKRRRVRGYLISNGSLMDGDIAQSMIQDRWDLVRVSTHAGDATTYKLIQGVDHFERVRENLQEYDRQRRAANLERVCGLHVHHVIQRENLETIPSMFEFGAAVGADHVVFERVFALSPEFRLTRSELARAASLLAQGAEEGRVSSNAVEVAGELHREMADAPEERLGAPEVDRSDAPEAAVIAEPASSPVNGAGGGLEEEDVEAAPAEAPFRPANRCSVGFDSSFINSNGDVLPCCFSNEVMGNVREQTFSEIWFGETYGAFRSRLIHGEFADYCASVRCNLRTFLHD